MEWWQLVFALFVITAYVLKHIVSTQQEQQARAPKPGGQRDWVEKARQAAAEAAKSDEDVARDRTELDRRIEDAIQRRRELDEEPARSSPLPKRAIPMPVPPVIKPVPRYEPRPAMELPTLPRPALPRPAPPRPVPPRPAPARSAMPRPTPAPPPVPAAKPAPPPVIAAQVLVVHPAPAVSAARPPSPAVAQVLDLLRDRKNLAAAVILHEILDRPRSRRRR